MAQNNREKEAWSQVQPYMDQANAKNEARQKKTKPPMKDIIQGLKEDYEKKTGKPYESTKKL